MQKNVPSKAQDRFQNALGLWIAFVCKKAVATVVIATILTVALFYYSLSQIGISTDTSDMLSPDLPFRQNSIALSKAFPQFSDNIVVVIDGPFYNFKPGPNRGKAVGRGGMWYQPGGMPHDNYCNPDTACSFFVYLPNGFDFIPIK